MSSPSIETDVTWIVFVHFPLLPNIITSQPQHWAKLSESGEDKHFPLATTLK